MYNTYLGQAAQADYKAPDNMVFTAHDGPPDKATDIMIGSWGNLSDYTVWVNANIDSKVKTSQDAIMHALNMGYIASPLAYQWIDFISNPTKYVGPAKGNKISPYIYLGGGVLAVMFIMFMVSGFGKKVYG